MKKMIFKAGILLIGCIVLIIINYVRKSKNGGKKQVIAKGSEVSQAFMMDTFEPIEDFEMVYFDENKGLVQIKTKAK